MGELLRALKAIRSLARDPKYDHFAPMVQVRQLCRQALELAGNLSVGRQPRKQLFVLLHPNNTRLEKIMNDENLAREKLALCGIPAEVLSLEDVDLEVIGADDAEASEPGRPHAQTGADPVSAQGATEPEPECVQ
jgi:hypothetical protein